MNTHLRNSLVETWDRDALLSLYVSNGVTGILDLDSTEKTSANQLDPEIVLAGPSQRFAASPLFERHSVAGLNEILVACSYARKDDDALPIEHPDTLAQAWVAEESDAPYDRKKAWDIFLPPNAKRSMKLTRAGEIDYYCRFHPNMVGHISVAP